MTVRFVAVICGLVILASAMAMAACGAGPQSGTAPAATPPPSTATRSPAFSPIQPAGLAATSTTQPAPAATHIATSPTVATAPRDPAPTATATAADPPPSATPRSQTARPPAQSVGSIRLQDDLDDPLGYCIDVRGFGSGIRLDADLQAHSCKQGFPEDQSFAISGTPFPGPVLLFQYGVCLAVTEPTEGASILLRQCDDPSVALEFDWMADGRLRLVTVSKTSPSNLCVGVAGGPGEPAGGRNHLRRDLMLVDCAAVEPALVTWKSAKN